MGWDAIISGELKFPKGGLAKWKAAPASVPDRAWPSWIAMAVDSSMYDEDPTVETVLDEVAEEDHWFGKIEIADPTVRVAYNVDGSNYTMAAERVVRVLCAAAKAGAKGRVLFCDAGGAIAGARFTGALFVLDGGKVKCEAKDNDPLAASDKKRIDAIVEAVVANYKRANAKSRRK